MNELLSIRLKAFAYEFAGSVGTLVVTFMLSDDFRVLVTSHFGETSTVVFVMFLVIGALKHNRNKNEQKKVGGNKAPVYF